MRTENFSKGIMLALYMLGFPIFLIATLVISIQWDSFGAYDVGAFAPFIFALIVWIITTFIAVIIRYVDRKNGKSKKRIMISVAVVPIVLIIGFFAILDVAMPSVLKKESSGTILYEDIIEDVDGMHDTLMQTVDMFKEKNGLHADVKVEDEEFQTLFYSMFYSMDKAFNSYNKVAVEMALHFPDLMDAIATGKMPIGVLATLLLNTTETNESDHTINIENLEDIKTLLVYNLMEILEGITYLSENITGIQDILDPEILNETIKIILLDKEFDGIKWNIMQLLGDNIIFPQFDPNADIFKEVNGEMVRIGAGLGYQDMAWIDGLKMMFFIPLMGAKELCIAFALTIALVSILVQVVKVSYYSKKKDVEIKQNDIIV